MLKFNEFRHNHHPSGVKMLENLFDVDFQLYILQRRSIIIQEGKT